MKSDSWFYRAFRDSPQPFFEMLRLPTELVSRYRFEAVELKDVALQIDGAYRPVQPGYPHIFLEAQLYRDEGFYPKWFAKIFLDLSKQPPSTDWKAMVLFAYRGDDDPRVQPWLAPWVEQGRVQRVYLAELPDFPVASPEVAVLKLGNVSKPSLLDKASQLAQQVRHLPNQHAVALELLESLVVSNFPNLTREEIQTLLQLHDIRESRVYQEGRQAGLEEGKIEQSRIYQEGRQAGLEGKIEQSRIYQEGRQAGLEESIAKLRAKGCTEQEIADLLDLSLEAVQQAIQPKPIAE